MSELESIGEEIMALSDRERAELLIELMQGAVSVCTGGTASADFGAEQVLAIWRQRQRARSAGHREREPHRRNVHILFSLSDAGSMKVTLSELGLRQDNEVLVFNEMFAVGPVDGLDTESGRQRRFRWMAERFRHYASDMVHNSEHGMKRMRAHLAAIPEDRTITLWGGNNAHDQTGLHAALHLLRGRQSPVRFINVSEALDASAEIDAHETSSPPCAQAYVSKEAFARMVRDFESLPLLEDASRRRYETEWRDRFADQPQTLRLWRNGRVESVPEAELDADVLAIVERLQRSEAASAEGYVKAGRIAADFFERDEQQMVGDAFLEYRLWRMVDAGLLSFRGLPTGLHTFSVRRVGRATTALIGF